MSATGQVRTHDPASQCARILRVLKKHRRITNVQMINMSVLRGSQRIRELKDEGHVIVSQRVHGGVWEYKYGGHRDDTERES
ncbi:helix-turn-helix domain-containing protein [Rhodococcus sp. B10]|uniref:helix-turn-helix domain-containing protein n=1 Tax=Rhodococcus sp. B10 TaxID=2695876 RepID=UPI00142F5E85|nr:hypothetical protein [Rhodococcus sp. B10]